MKLNNRAVDNAKPREKKWKLADGGVLHLLIHPNSGKYWRCKYRLVTYWPCPRAYQRSCTEPLRGLFFLLRKCRGR